MVQAAIIQKKHKEKTALKQSPFKAVFIFGPERLHRSGFFAGLHDFGVEPERIHAIMALAED